MFLANFQARRFHRLAQKAPDSEETVFTQFYTAASRLTVSG